MSVRGYDVRASACLKFDLLHFIGFNLISECGLGMRALTRSIGIFRVLEKESANVIDY